MASTTARLEQEGIDRLKTEQSAEYWQSSFETTEKHFMEEKKRATAEISKLSEAAEQMKARLQKADEQIEALCKENAALSHFKSEVEGTR